MHATDSRARECLDFEGTLQTKRIWYYQLTPGRSLGKTNPLNDDDLAEFVTLQKKRSDTPKSWTVNVAVLNATTFDLSVSNPNGGEVVVHRAPNEILDEIVALDAESAEVLASIRGLV